MDVRVQSSNRLRRHVQMLGLLAALCVCAPALAQDAATSAVTPAGGDESQGADLRAQVEPLQEQLKTLREQLTTATDLEPEDRTKIEEALNTANSSLTEADKSLSQAAADDQISEGLPKEREDLEQQQKELEESGPPVVPQDATLPELEASAAELQDKLNGLTAGNEQPDDSQTRAADRKELREQLVSLPDMIANFPETPAVNDGDPPLLTEAEKLANDSQKLEAEAQLQAVKARLSRYDAEDAYNVARLRRDVNTLKINRTEAELKAYEQRISQRRQELATERVLEACRALASAPPDEPAVKDIIRGPLVIGDDEFNGSLQLALEEAEIRIGVSQLERFLEDVRKDNRDDEKLTAALDSALNYVETLKGLNRPSMPELAARLETDQQELQQVQTWLEQAKIRVDTTGPTQALGFRLRQQRERLPNLLQVRRRRNDRLRTIEAAQNSFLDYNEQLNDWMDVDSVVKSILDGKTVSDDEQAAVRQAVQQRKADLTELVKAYTDYTKTLDDLDVKESSLIAETETFTDFVNERILWIRSNQPLDLESLRSREAFESVLKPTLLWVIVRGAGIPGVISEDLLDHFILWVVFGVLFLALLIRASALRRKLRELARIAQGRVTTAMKPTFEAWLISAAISIPWPGLILMFAWRVSVNSDTTEVSTLSQGLVQLGLAFLSLEFFRQVCRPSGLADAHFEWPDRTIILLRRTFRGLILFALPVGAVVVLLHAHRSVPGPENDAYEMLAFVVLLLILLAYLHRLLKPSTGVLREWVANRNEGWGRRLQYPIYLAGVGLCTVLTVLTVMGYYYTAQRLFEKTQITLWLVFGLVFVRALLYRALTLHRRRLALEQLRQRRAAASAAAGEATTSSVPDIPVELPPDLGHVSRQTQKLLDTTLIVVGLVALWGVWIDVLPALNYLKQWTVWEEQPLTYFDLGMAVLITLLAITAARNVPGLLEISVLQRLPLDASSRYATTTITRYLITLLGIVLVSNVIGIGWGQVQWLAAALTVGLGFGLQEIFANFVSGIIILFEQPVRVGDVVTIGEVSGVVSRIRMRSTTITDWDRKEYVVPNKEFITGRLLNWTLSDTTNRIVINVGVAYGSDTNRVHEIISRIAAEHQHVLKEPPPLVTFETFGDSSLNFVLRAYLAVLDHRLITISELNAAIHNELTRAGIEIPFPQRDLHLKSWPESLDRALAEREPEYQHDG